MTIDRQIESIRAKIHFQYWKRICQVLNSFLRSQFNTVGVPDTGAIEETEALHEISSRLHLQLVFGTNQRNNIHHEYSKPDSDTWCSWSCWYPSERRLQSTLSKHSCKLNELLKVGSSKQALPKMDEKINFGELQPKFCMWHKVISSCPISTDIDR
jgi:hypothetical protein